MATHTPEIHVLPEPATERAADVAEHGPNDDAIVAKSCTVLNEATTEKANGTSRNGRRGGVASARELTAPLLGIAHHVIKLHLLVLALFACLWIYCLAVTWLWMFWLQTRLCLASARALRVVFELPPGGKVKGSANGAAIGENEDTESKIRRALGRAGSGSLDGGSGDALADLGLEPAACGAVPVPSTAITASDDDFTLFEDFLSSPKSSAATKSQEDALSGDTTSSAPKQKHVMAPLDSQETQPIESEVPSDEVLEAQIKADEQRYEELIRLKMSQERQHEDTFHDAEPSNVQDSSDVKEQQPKKDLPVTVRVGSHEKKIKAQSDWVNALKSGVDPSEPRAGKRSGSRSYTDDSRPSGVPSKSDYGFGSRRDSDWSEADDSFLKELDELDQSVDIRPPLTDQHDPLESPQRTSSVKPTPPLMFTEAQLAEARSFMSGATRVEDKGRSHQTPRSQSLRSVKKPPPDSSTYRDRGPVWKKLPPPPTPSPSRPVERFQPSHSKGNTTPSKEPQSTDSGEKRLPPHLRKAVAARAATMSSETSSDNEVVETAEPSEEPSSTSKSKPESDVTTKQSVALPLELATEPVDTDDTPKKEGSNGGPQSPATADHLHVSDSFSAGRADVAASQAPVPSWLSAPEDRASEFQIALDKPSATREIFGQNVENNILAHLPKGLQHSRHAPNATEATQKLSVEKLLSMEPEELRKPLNALELKHSQGPANAFPLIISESGYRPSFPNFHSSANAPPFGLDLPFIGYGPVQKERTALSAAAPPFFAPFERQFTAEELLALNPESQSRATPAYLGPLSGDSLNVRPIFGNINDRITSDVHSTASTQQPPPAHSATQALVYKPHDQLNLAFTGQRALGPAAATFGMTELANDDSGRMIRVRMQHGNSTTPEEAIAVERRDAEMFGAGQAPVMTDQDSIVRNMVEVLNVQAHRKRASMDRLSKTSLVAAHSDTDRQSISSSDKDQYHAVSVTTNDSQGPYDNGPRPAQRKMDPQSRPLMIELPSPRVTVRLPPSMEAVSGSSRKVPPGLGEPVPEWQARFDALLDEGKAVHTAWDDVSAIGDFGYLKVVNEGSRGADLEEPNDELAKDLTKDLLHHDATVRNPATLSSAIDDTNDRESLPGNATASDSATASGAGLDLKHRIVNAKRAVKAAWTDREEARIHLLGSWSLEKRQNLDKVTAVYHELRAVLANTMASGKLSAIMAKKYPVYGKNDVGPPKHRHLHKPGSANMMPKHGDSSKQEQIKVLKQAAYNALRVRKDILENRRKYGSRKYGVKLWGPRVDAATADYRAKRKTLSAMFYRGLPSALVKVLPSFWNEEVVDDAGTDD